MKKGIILIGVLTLVMSFAGMAGCDEKKPEVSGFNLEFKYGITARNILDTFEGTYTKDMVADPPVSIDLSLSEEEKDIIYQKMVEIDFFNYPDEFFIEVSTTETITTFTPHNSYYFKVEYDSQIKELRWDDDITKPDEKADRLRELILLIRNIIESKEEYKELPEPTSAYS